MEEKEWVKRLLSYAESTGKKPAEDLYTAILRRISRNHSQDVTIEYFETLDDLRLIKSAIQILLEEDGLDETKKKRGKGILNSIDKTRFFVSSKPVIDHDQSKYTFRDGSNSRFEDLEKVEGMIVKTELFNKITELSDVCSDGLAFLGIQQKEFWHREDMLEEITPTLDKIEGENG